MKVFVIKRKEYNLNLKKFDPKKLTVLREKAGLTFLELSREMKRYEKKISKMSIWGWERGDHEPSLKYLSIMSAYFKVPIEYFMKK